MIYRLRISYRCPCYGPLNIGENLSKRGPFDNLNDAYKAAEDYNVAHNGITRCKCQVEVVEVEE